MGIKTRIYISRIRFSGWDRKHMEIPSYMAGQNGGAAFTMVYLLCILVVGLTIVIAEFAIGRSTQLSPVGAFEKLAPNSNWKWVGFLGVASAFVIFLSFYGVVGGWILKYVFVSISGGFDTLNNDPEAAKSLFRHLQALHGRQYFFK